MSETVAEHSVPPPHLAHHFGTPAQQYTSAKLGMWVFLGTEILMFGGLFCAYGVYRHEHPEVFVFAHQALNPVLGGINTAVLITSSLTMAMAVRFAQLGQTKALMTCLLLTTLGGAGFMGIKTIEYKTKWEHHLFPGKYNVYNKEFSGDEAKPNDLAALEGGGGGEVSERASPQGQTPATNITTQPASQLGSYIDPFTGTPDESKIKPSFVDPSGLSSAHRLVRLHRNAPTYSDLPYLDQDRVNAFFSVYFLMTGLHGVHVLIGMALIVWILLRARRGEFGPGYFTPVDLVGLYWHLVDLIWIFLFPLLYLIH